MRNRLLLVILCIPMFLVLLDVLAMSVAMPTIGRGFGVPVAAWPQIIDAYTVPLAVALLPGGWLVDRVGARRTLLGRIVVFTVCSAAGGLASGWWTVLAARFGQGVSAAVMLPAGLAALSLAWPQPSERARALGAWASISAVATALGPALGGLLVAATSWRMVFWFNVPLGIFALWGTWARLPADHPGARSQHLDHPVRPDVRALVGSVIVAAMMTSGANGTLQVVTVALQRDLQIGAGIAGVVLLLATAPFVIVGPICGDMVTRWGRRRVAAVGFVVGAVGMATLGFTGGVWGMVPALLGIGVGLGFITSSVVGETLAAWAARPGVASGLNNALRQVGTSAGVAVGGLATHWWQGSSLLRHSGPTASAWWVLAAVVVTTTFVRAGQPSLDGR